MFQVASSPAAYAQAQAMSMPRKSSPRQSSPLSPLRSAPNKAPPPLDALPFAITANPTQPWDAQVERGQTLRWYGALLCVSHWDAQGRRHGSEAYVHVPDAALGAPRVLCVLEWKHGACAERLAAFNLSSIDLRHCRADAPLAEQRRGGKSVELLSNDVLRVCHWRRTNNSDDAEPQRSGADRYYAVFPERPPVLLKEQWWRGGVRDGAEVHYADADPCEWLAPRAVEVARRHWLGGALSGAELCTSLQTGTRVERAWLDGCLHGAEVHRYANGRRQLEAAWVHGRRSGEWTLWYKNGELCERGTYRNGTREGVWLRCDRRGRVERCLTYARGREWGAQLRRASTGAGLVPRVLDEAEIEHRRRAAIARELDALRTKLADADASARPPLERKLQRLLARPL